MKTPSVYLVKKYLSAIKKAKRKYVTSDLLSRKVGVYPEVINETLSYFDPMVNMDYQYDLMQLVPQMEQYVEEVEAMKPASEPSVRVTKKEVLEYDSIADFIYRKMTVGGIVDKSARLNDQDLHILKKLVASEIEDRKPKKKKRK